MDNAVTFATPQASHIISATQHQHLTPQEHQIYTRKLAGAGRVQARVTWHQKCWPFCLQEANTPTGVLPLQNQKSSLMRNQMPQLWSLWRIYWPILKMHYSKRKGQSRESSEQLPMSTFGGEEGRHTQELEKFLRNGQITYMNSCFQMSYLSRSHWFSWPWRVTNT